MQSIHKETFSLDSSLDGIIIGSTLYGLSCPLALFYNPSIVEDALLLLVTILDDTRNEEMIPSERTDFVLDVVEIVCWYMVRKVPTTNLNNLRLTLCTAYISGELKKHFASLK